MKKINLSKFIVYISFFIVLIGFSILLPGKFMTASNLLNILRQTAMISVAAIGMTFAITTDRLIDWRSYSNKQSFDGIDASESTYDCSGTGWTWGWNCIWSS